MDQKVDYGFLKEWIAKQEATEAQTGAPAPITAAQRQALEVLRIQAATTTTQDISFDTKTDWVSKLNLLCQAQPKERKARFEYTDRSVSYPSIGTRWICTVTYDEVGRNGLTTRMTFPLEDESVGGGGTAEEFQSKKVGRQYAAMKCVQWLRAAKGGSSSSSAAAAAAAAPATEATFIRAVADAAASPPPTTAGAAAATAAAAAIAARKDPAVEGLTDDLVQRVHELCRKLGFRDPIYKFTADPTSDEIWHGHVDFGGDQDLLPDSLGCVTGVGSQKQAKWIMAEQLKLHLEGILLERQNVVDHMMENKEGPAIKSEAA